MRLYGLDGGYTQVLIDGAPVFSGLSGVYGLEQIQTGGIEQIEIVKGAGSALYGGDALGGVINIRIKEPTYRPNMTIATEVNEHNDLGMRFSGGLRKENAGISAYWQYNKKNAIDQTGNIDEDYIETGNYNDAGKDGFTDRVASRNSGGGVKLYFYDVINAGWTLNFFGRSMEEFRQGGFLETYFDPFDVDAEHISTSKNEFGGAFEMPFGTRKINVSAIYTNMHRSATNGAAWDKAIMAGMVDNGIDLTDAGRAYIEEHGFNEFRANYYPQPFLTDEEIIATDATFSNPFVLNGDMLFGVQLKKSDIVQNINGGEDDEKSALDAGAFVQLSIKPFTDRFETVIGGRIDHHESSDDIAKRVALETGETYEEYNSTVFNPRVALRYTVTEDLTLRTAFGTGYKVPYLFAEDLHLCASSPKIFKGSDLKPEKSQTVSLSLEYYFHLGTVGINLFHVNIDDKVEFIDPDGGTVPEGYDYRWVNSESAKSTGAEFVFSGTRSWWLEYQLSFAYTYARYENKRFSEEISGYENSDMIPRTPAMTGSLSFKVKPYSMLWLSMNARYTEVCL